MEFAKVTRDFGQTFKEGDDIEKFLNDLVDFVERETYLARKVNFLLTRVNDQKFEFVASGNKDKDEDGNWRIIESSGDLQFQKRVSGTWTNADKIRGS